MGVKFKKELCSFSNPRTSNSLYRSPCTILGQYLGWVLWLFQTHLDVKTVFYFQIYLKGCSDQNQKFFLTSRLKFLLFLLSEAWSWFRSLQGERGVWDWLSTLLLLAFLLLWIAYGTLLPWLLQGLDCITHGSFKGQDLAQWVLYYPISLPSMWWIPSADVVLHRMVLWVFQRLLLPGRRLHSGLWIALCGALSARALMTFPQVQSYDSSPILRIFLLGLSCPSRQGSGVRPFQNDTTLATFQGDRLAHGKTWQPLAFSFF